MSVITKLKLQTKNKNRVNVYLDEEYVCALQLETIMRFQVKEGMQVTKEQLLTMQLDSEKEQAYLKVLNLISKSMKTKVQIERYLKQKGYAQKTVKYVTSKLEEYNYVNDALYAKLYIKQEAKKSGVNKIRQQLFLKGVPKEVLEEALLELPNQEQEIEHLIEKYMKNKEYTKKEVSKLYAYLLRRGFTYDQIKPFIKG
jgi:regulatory protein